MNFSDDYFKDVSKGITEEDKVKAGYRLIERSTLPLLKKYDPNDVSDKLLVKDDPNDVSDKLLGKDEPNDLRDKLYVEGKPIIIKKYDPNDLDDLHKTSKDIVNETNIKEINAKLFGESETSLKKDTITDKDMEQILKKYDAKLYGESETPMKKYDVKEEDASKSYEPETLDDRLITIEDSLITIEGRILSLTQQTKRLQRNLNFSLIGMTILMSVAMQFFIRM